MHLRKAAQDASLLDMLYISAIFELYMSIRLNCGDKSLNIGFGYALTSADITTHMSSFLIPLLYKIS